MKTSQILNILLAVTLVLLSVKLVTGSKNKSENTQGQDTTLETIMTRASIRDYQDKPVEDGKIEAMLRAAMAAPSAGNKQPWRFIVIKDKNTLKAISENFHTMTMADKAPLAIVVCGDMKATFGGDAMGYWVEDASAATENILLAAHSLELGAVWCGIYPQVQRVKLLKEMLDIPEDIIPLNVVLIGYPAENPEPQDKWDSSEIHYETWSGAAANFTLSDDARSKAREWKQIEPSALRANPFDLFSHALSLSVGTKDKMNAMTIGWGGLGVLWGRDRPVMTVYVREDRFTF